MFPWLKDHPQFTQVRHKLIIPFRNRWWFYYSDSWSYIFLTKLQHSYNYLWFLVITFLVICNLLWPFVTFHNFLYFLKNWKNWSKPYVLIHFFQKICQTLGFYPKKIKTFSNHTPKGQKAQQYLRNTVFTVYGSYRAELVLTECMCETCSIVILSPWHVNISVQIYF